MKFVAIADTHCRHHNLRLPKGDVLLHAGDISYRGGKAEVLDFLQWFAKQNFKHKIFIAGNHDFYFEKKTPDQIHSFLPPGVVYLNNSGIDIDGVRIWGSPITPWYFQWAFNLKRGPAMHKQWQLIPEQTDILMTHGPAYGILDIVLNGNHAGCKDLLDRIDVVKPKVHVCGHIHEGYGNLVKKNTRFINASVLNESYELVNRPVSFEL